ncbi:MAG TPA: Gfo/Idh/MocA family oxidoreductase [Kineosporiaceae bacterium]|nr:Gfo/Idh/MocA family oxidoreductase [Kineosporiaceae bacterium]
MPPLRVGVIGCGYWGPNLVRNFARHPEVKVEAVCDRDLKRAERTGAEYRVPTVAASPDALFGAKQLDLIVVATPTATHFELAKAALSAGKHVLVMKPLTSSGEQAEELAHLAGKRGVLLAVDHTFVFTAAVRKMKELATNGALGELYYFDSVRVNLGLFQRDINVIWDLAPHDISILDFLVGGEPEEILAVGVAHGQSPTENIAYITIKYPNSFLAHVHVNWLAPAKVRQLILGGSKKMVVYDDVQPSEKVKVYDKGVSFQNDADPYKALVSYRSGDMVAPQLDGKEALAVEVDNIVKAVRGKEQLVSDGAAGVRVVHLLEAAQRSIAQGGSPVRLGALAGSAA